MQGDLPKHCRKHECGVINLYDDEVPGTHWVSYYKKDNDTCYYFVNFRDLQPFKEFIGCVGNNCKILYN